MGVVKVVKVTKTPSALSAEYSSIKEYKMTNWKTVELKTLPWGSVFFMGNTKYEVSMTIEQSFDGVVEGVNVEEGRFVDFHPNTSVRVAA